MNILLSLVVLRYSKTDNLPKVAYFSTQPVCLCSRLQCTKQDRSIGSEKRLVPTVGVLFQHRRPRGFAGCQAAVTHRAVCLFSLPSSWPYGARGSQGHCVSQICRCVLQRAYTCACLCIAYEMSQICLLLSVDLAVGCIDFVSICIFLPAKNTFISSTNIEQRAVDSFHILLRWTQSSCSAGFQFPITTKWAVSTDVTLFHCTTARKTPDDKYKCQRSETLYRLKMMKCLLLHCQLIWGQLVRADMVT